jgi:hypothetical protein
MRNIEWNIINAIIVKTDLINRVMFILNNKYSNIN